MPESSADIVRTYFEQQAQMGMPDLLVDRDLLNISGAPSAAHTREIPESLSQTGPVGDSYEEKRAALVDLYHNTRNCRNCDLGQLRTKYVFGAGNAAAPVMVVGEAPGQEEDLQGVPFVGAAGQLLTKMLGAVNLDRDKDVFITNIVKCRPPGNRNPDGAEAQGCNAILGRQIDIISPKILLVLGRVAASELLGRTESLAKLRGEKLDYKGIPAVVTYHPAALLRNASYKRPAWEDLQRLQAMLKEL